MQTGDGEEVEILGRDQFEIIRKGVDEKKAALAMMETAKRRLEQAANLETWDEDVIDNLKRLISGMIDRYTYVLVHEPDSINPNYIDKAMKTAYDIMRNLEGKPSELKGSMHVRLEEKRDRKQLIGILTGKAIEGREESKNRDPAPAKAGKRR